MEKSSVQIWKDDKIKREDFERILELPTATLSTKSMLIYLHISQFFQFNLKKNWYKHYSDVRFVR
jgi:hypothetical protein